MAKLVLRTEYDPRGLAGWFEVQDDEGGVLATTLRFGDIAAARILSLGDLKRIGHVGMIPEGSRLIDVLVVWLEQYTRGGTATFFFEGGRPIAEIEYTPEADEPPVCKALLGGPELGFRPVGRSRSLVPEFSMDGLFRFLRQRGVATEVDEEKWERARRRRPPEDDEG